VYRAVLPLVMSSAFRDLIILVVRPGSRPGYSHYGRCCVSVVVVVVVGGTIGGVLVTCSVVVVVWL
jgi:hypothetical protein